MNKLERKIIRYTFPIKFWWLKKRWINCEPCKMLVKPAYWKEHKLNFHPFMGTLRDWHTND